MRKYALLFLAAAREFSAKKGPTMAAAVAYWAVLSLFPLALGGLSLLGYVFETPEERHRLVLDALEVVPVSAGFIETTLAEIAEKRGALTIIAAVGSVWSGLAVFGALRAGLNQVWQVDRPRSFFKGRAVDFLIFLGVATGSIATLAYTSVGAATANVAPEWVREQFLFGEAFKIAIDVGALAITYGGFLLLFRYVPNAQLRFADLWLGALVGAILFQALRLGFAWFANGVGQYNVIYGSVGAIVAVMVWAYLSAMAVLWGAQVSESYAGLFGSRASAAEASALERQYGWLLSPRTIMQTARDRARQFARRTPALRRMVGPVKTQAGSASQGSEGASEEEKK